MAKTKISKKTALLSLLYLTFFLFVFTAKTNDWQVHQGPGPPASDDLSQTNSKKAEGGKQPKPETDKPGGEKKNIKANTQNFRKYAVNYQEKTFTKHGETYPIRVYKPLALPNDTYADQWWVSPTGMESAWDIGAGPTDVKIAIIDTGYALNHQEFSGRWATSSGESGTATSENPSDLNCSDQNISLNQSCNNIDDNFDGIVDNESGATSIENPSWLNCSGQSLALDKSCNRIDDDGNGLIDDYRGWDFSNFDHSPQAGEVNPDGSGTDHGTMTAGILGATGNNNAGIAGVNWNAKILPIQALDDFSYGDSITVGDSVYYAVDQGADVISISLGTDADDPYLRQAILYAMANDVIVVAAAGNDGCNCMVWPARYPEVVSAGASTPSGSTASFSSYGAELDIIAPGKNMTTPVWTKNNQVSAYVANAAGTSFSTPFVAGLLGLMRSWQPDASWDELTGALFENADRKTLTAASPHSLTIGFGFAKASSALSRVTQAYSPETIYRFSGNLLGSERVRACSGGIIPGSFLYELSKSGQINYTVNQYQKRLKTAGGWTAKKLFGLCMGLPTDTPVFLRALNLSQEIRNQLLKQ